MLLTAFGEGEGWGFDSLTRLPSALPTTFFSAASAVTQNAINANIITTKSAILFMLLVPPCLLVFFFIGSLIPYSLKSNHHGRKRDSEWANIFFSGYRSCRCGMPARSTV
jgi:hypothetical protein